MKQSLQIAAAELSLEGLDGLPPCDLVAFAGEEERPLRGLPGLVDWRLCGALSRLVKAEHFTGARHAPLLTVSGGAIPAARIFLFGVGQAAALAKAAPGAYLEEAFAVVARAGGERVALALPATEPLAIGALARPLVEAARAAGLREVTLLHKDVRGADRALAVAAEAVPGVRLGA